MKEKHQKMRLNASGHQSENERQLKKFNLAVFILETLKSSRRI